MAAKQASNVIAFPARKPARTSRTVNFTDPWVARQCALSEQRAGREEFSDAHTKSLRVRFSNGVASYSVVRRIPGQKAPKRHPIGDNATDRLNVKRARELAAILIGEIVTKGGKTVARVRAAEKTANEMQQRTVNDLLAEYLANKVWGGRNLSARTGEKYNEEIAALLGPLFFKPWHMLTPANVGAAYRKRCERFDSINARGGTFVAGSPSGAKIAVDALAAISTYFGKDVLEDPTRELVKKKQMQAIGVRAPRLGDVEAQELIAWLFNNVKRQRNSPTYVTMCEMFIITMTMGLRMDSLRNLRWEYTGTLKAQPYVRIPSDQLKSKPEQDPVLPIPPRTWAMLQDRAKRYGNPKAGLIFGCESDPDSPMPITSKFKAELPAPSSAHDGRKVFNLFVGRHAPRNAQLGLMTHAGNSDDVNYRAYYKAFPWQTKLRDMAGPSALCEAELCAMVGKASAIRAAESFHVEHCKAFVKKEQGYYKTRRAKQRVLKAKARA